MLPVTLLTMEITTSDLAANFSLVHPTALLWSLAVRPIYNSHQNLLLIEPSSSLHRQERYPHLCPFLNRIDLDLGTMPLVIRFAAYLAPAHILYLYLGLHLLRLEIECDNVRCRICEVISTSKLNYLRRANCMCPSYGAPVHIASS